MYIYICKECNIMGSRGSRLIPGSAFLGLQAWSSETWSATWSACPWCFSP